MADRR